MMNRTAKTLKGIFVKNTKLTLSIISFVFAFFILTLISNFVYATITSITLNSPVNEYNTTDTTPDFNFTAISDINSTFTCELFINDTGYGTVTANNNTPTTITANTSLSDGKYVWYINCTDANGTVKSSERNITIDTTAPSISFSVSNQTGATQMIGSINATVTDALLPIDTCYYTIYHPNGSITTETAMVSGSGSTKYCYLELNSSNLYGYGRFVVQLTVNDTLGNSASSNSTNWTIIMLGEGWNLIQADRNGTLSDFNLTGYITKVSWYNNSAKNYTTWVKGSATNQDFPVTDGDALYVYSTATTYLVRYWNVDVTSRNLTLTSGWNQATHFNLSSLTLSQLCSESLENASAGIIYVTFVNQTGFYWSHRCGFSFNADVEVPRGYGYWLKVNATTNYIRNRE